MDKNQKMLFSVLGFAGVMIALSFASVPLYRTLCQITGWGGTTKRAEAPAVEKIYKREMIVQFDAGTAPDMPWAFKPDLRQVKVKVGQQALISYSAENKSAKPVAGSAVFNVTPMLAGKYFNKIQCFCFQEQILAPGQKVHMPVTFFIDPKIMDDHDLRDLKTITLSYTFYRDQSPALEKATEKFYSEGTAPSSAAKS
jgi:cytochrome c oxidase assembly protein subunit 11